MVRFLRIAGIVSLAASVLCGVPFVATFYYAYDSDGALFFAVPCLIAMFAMAVVGGLLGCIAIARLFVVAPADRGTVLRSLGAFAMPGLVLVGGLFGASTAARSMRCSEFEALAERAQPLIDAIGRFQHDKGHPPRTLADLVPDYSPIVPKTGHARYPNFEYEVLHPPDESSMWELRVRCPLGFSNWDEFFYWPTEEYPEHTGSGSIERIGRWAYLHE